MGKLAVMSLESLPVFFMSSVVLNQATQCGVEYKGHSFQFTKSLIIINPSCKSFKSDQSGIIVQISVAWLDCCSNFARQPMSIPPGAYVLVDRLT